MTHKLLSVVKKSGFYLFSSFQEHLQVWLIEHGHFLDHNLVQFETIWFHSYVPKYDWPIHQIQLDRILQVAYPKMINATLRNRNDVILTEYWHWTLVLLISSRHIAMFEFRLMKSTIDWLNRCSSCSRNDIGSGEKNKFFSSVGFSWIYD